MPLFFVEHLALTLPWFLLLPPTCPPPNSYRERHAGSSRPAGSHASKPFLPLLLSRRLAKIYLPCMVCICPNCCNRQTLREERGKWGERVTGRQRGRNREGDSESNRRGEGGRALYVGYMYMMRVKYVNFDSKKGNGFSVADKCSSSFWWSSPHSCSQSPDQSSTVQTEGDPG